MATATESDHQVPAQKTVTKMHGAFEAHAVAAIPIRLPREKWYDKYGRFILPVGASVVGLGIVWLTLLNFTEDKSVLRNVLLHLGTGFIVAGIVGAGYEVHSYERRIADLIQHLRAMRGLDARDSLNQVINGLFPLEVPENDPHSVFREDIRQLIFSVLQIDADAWAANTVSVKFVAKLLHFSTRAAVALSSAKPEAGGDHTLLLPVSAAHLVDDILADHIGVLHKEDTYRVISDFSTWTHGQLSKFHDATMLAIKERHIFVRRVFCWFPADAMMTRSEAMKILHRHWQLALRSPMLRGVRLYQVGVCLDTVASYPHLGIFTCNQQTICFAPGPGPALAEIQFSRSKDIDRFEECWANTVKAVTYDKCGHETVIDCDQLEDRIERMAPDWLCGFRGDPGRGARC